MTRPTFLSLFSGIGGLDLGLERAGWTCVGQVENDPYCNRVLAKHWPDVPRWGDIREVDPHDLPRADLVAGGFPCQPVSSAGKRLAQDDPRWLWPEMARIIRGLRPRWALMENVPGLLAQGMGDVLGELAASGYDAEWDCIPASAVGAPHRRYRVFVVAYPGGERHGADTRAIRGDAVRADEQANSHQPRRSGPHVADAPKIGGEPYGWLQQPGNGHPQRHVPKWTTEPDVDRMVDGVSARVDRLGALGNAVVPQVAELIGRRILTAQEGAA